MANSGSRRGSALVASLLALIAAGGLSFLGARAAADFLETRSLQDVTEALQQGGYDWVQVQTAQYMRTAPAAIHWANALADRGTAPQDGSLKRLSGSEDRKTGRP